MPEERKQEDYNLNIFRGAAIHEDTDDISLLTYPGLFPFGLGDIFSKKTKNKVSATSKKKVKDLMKKSIIIGDKLHYYYQEQEQFPYWALNLTMRSESVYSAKVYMDN